MTIPDTVKRIILLLLILLIFNIVTVSLGGDESSLTVANLTEHYLHVFIDNEEYLYIAPDRSVVYATEAKPSIFVTALYAPGQGISAASVDTTIEVPYRSARETCNCSEDDAWGDCIYTPAVGGSARLEILPEHLQPEE